MNFDTRFSALATAITLSLVATGAQAAGKIDLHKQNLVQLKQQYQAVAANRGIAAMAHTRHEQFIGADAHSRLLMKAKREDHGVRNYRYDQTFRGIPVFGEGVVVSEDTAGNVRKLFGNMVGGLDQDIASTTPKISRAAALAAGKQGHLGSRMSAYRTENEKSDLVVFVDDNGHGHLAYAVSYFADGANVKPTRPMILIDANSGQVLKKWENLQHALIGTGPGGNAKTGQYEFGTTYGYLDVSQSGSTCTMNSTNVKTVNLNNSSTNTSNTAFSYTCPRNTVKAINGAYSPLNDAHYFGAVIQNMYNAYTGANALSFQLVMKVHYKTNYENAFWNGTAMSLRRWRQHVLSAGQRRRVRPRGLARLHRAALQPDLFRPVGRHERSLLRHGWRSDRILLEGQQRLQRRHRDLQGQRCAALHVQPDPGRRLDRQRRELHQQHGRALHLGRVQQGVLHPGQEVRLGYAEGVQGVRPRQCQLLDGQQHVQPGRVWRPNRCG